MGVSGSGKTTIGRLLARRLGGDFIDADDFHPASNLAKMERSVPLDDEDRWPWLDQISREISKRRIDASLVLACSALKEAYRERLNLQGFRVVCLEGSADIIAPRLAGRTDHFMPASLLASQLAEMEEPAEGLVVAISKSPEDIVDQIVRELGGQSA